MKWNGIFFIQEFKNLFFLWKFQETADRELYRSAWKQRYAQTAETQGKEAFDNTKGRMSLSAGHVVASRNTTHIATNIILWTKGLLSNQGISLPAFPEMQFCYNKEKSSGFVLPQSLTQEDSFSIASPPTLRGVVCIFLHILYSCPTPKSWIRHTACVILVCFFLYQENLNTGDKKSEFKRKSPSTALSMNFLPHTPFCTAKPNLMRKLLT